MTQLTVSLYCGFCGATSEQNISMRKGWDTHIRAVDEEHAFCPKHSKIREFSEAQCPGCVGGWGDCPLWDAFAYRELKLTEQDFATLERGVCPKRVNGTIGITLTGGKTQIEQIDLRDGDAHKAGSALSKAIREYAKRYHK